VQSRLRVPNSAAAATCVSLALKPAANKNIELLYIVEEAQKEAATTTSATYMIIRF